MPSPPLHSVNGEDRRRRIREILRSSEVHSQRELARRLAGEGIHTTQPMLSRDLRALGVVKREGVYRWKDPERVTPLETLRSLLRGVKAAGPNLVVVSCEPGAANAIARAFEAEGLPEVVGSIAGDDTVFVAVPSKTAGQRVRRHIQSLL